MKLAIGPLPPAASTFWSSPFLQSVSYSPCLQLRHWTCLATAPFASDAAASTPQHTKARAARPN